MEAVHSRRPVQLLAGFGTLATQLHLAVKYRRLTPIAPSTTPYIVTLTVTNSVGTSTIQTFFGQMVYNNGGPPAMQVLAITVNPLLPPTGPTITQTSDKFLTQACYDNTIHFSAPAVMPPFPITDYLIYRDPARTKFVGRVEAIGPGPYSFTVCSEKKHATYYIFSQDETDAISSTFIKVSI